MAPAKHSIQADAIGDTGADTVAHAVAVAQFAPGTDKAENLAVIRQLATRAVERGAELVVFPEYSSFFTAELGEHSVAAAEPLDGAIRLRSW